MKANNKSRVLHITNWYPTFEEPKKALWIQRQIESLNPYIEGDVIHLEVESGKFKVQHGVQLSGNKAFLWKVPVSFWKIKEWLTSLLLVWVLLFKVPLKKYDIVNFHIAYPLCTHLHLIKKLFSKKWVVNEHWSAYRLNFGIKREEKLKRIKNIFRQEGIKWITVSQALANDIRRFSGVKSLPVQIVPNLVDDQTFFPVEGKRRPLQFFAVSQWKEPKDPFVLLKAFREFVSEYPAAVLRIGGYGPQWEQMQEMRQALNLEENVSFLGRLNESQIALEMQKAQAFVHCSDYETFSVVCAEALCCGTPVIASSVGGIKEFVHAANGYLVEQHTVRAWREVFEKFVERSDLSSALIAEGARKLFNKVEVGKKYRQVILPDNEHIVNAEVL